MRHIILVLIALIALVGLMPGGMSKNPAPFESINADTVSPNGMTASMASFLNDSWSPVSFVPPVEGQTAGFTRRAPSNNTTLNTTYAIYDFLTNETNATNVTNATSSAALPTYNVEAGSMYQFLRDDWTPNAPLPQIKTGAYTKGEMS